MCKSTLLQHFWGNCNYPLTIEIQFFPDEDILKAPARCGKIFLKLIIRSPDHDSCHWLLDGVSVSLLCISYLSCRTKKLAGVGVCGNNFRRWEKWCWSCFPLQQFSLRTTKSQELSQPLRREKSGGIQPMASQPRHHVKAAVAAAAAAAGKTI